MNERDSFIDILKTISIIMIIITHDPFFVEHYTMPICVYIIDMAVPIFMFVSGHNYAISSINRDHNFIELYRPSNFFSKILRYLIPYSLVFFTVAILLVQFKDKTYSFYTLFIDYIKGGYGPGSYYTPVMIQFIFISPLLLQLIKKAKEKGLLFAFLFNLIYEIMLTYGIHIPDYSRLILRYVFIISCGMYYAISVKSYTGINKNKFILLLSYVVGIIYLTYTQYISRPHLFIRWTTTSMAVSFYIIPIILYVKFLFKKYGKNTNATIIQTISSATYHIYLTQMTYYFIGLSRFINLSVFFRILISNIICITCGVLFYASENATKKILMTKGHITD